MLLELFKCLFNRHRPVRNEVDFYRDSYVGHCRYCGARIRRVGHRDWRRYRWRID